MKQEQKKSQEGLSVKKEENFSEWYTQLILKAELADYTSVSGCMVFKPTAWQIWEKIRDEVDKKLKKMGVKNVYFPMFIPESLLKKERHKFKKSLIITETIFSMDGDRPSLKEIVSLKEKYNSMIMVDEAHATGIFGENGSGVVEEENLTGNIDLIMGTFSKALGSFGAYLACSNRVKEYLINICRSFIYSTALPPSVIAANLVSLDLVRDEPFRRKTLLENANYLRQELQKHGFRVKGTSQIIPLIIGDSQKAIKLSENLKKNGYYVLPIRPPTVPAGEARLRFSLTWQHSKNILEKLVDDICRIYDI